MFCEVSENGEIRLTATGSIEMNLLKRLSDGVHIQAYDEGNGYCSHIIIVPVLIPVKEKRGITDLQLAELCSFADKLDATGNTVYAIQFNEYLDELSKETGYSIPEIKNRVRDYKKNR